MNKSSIEWTEKTWNPVTGCNKLSQGCKHCYAATLAKRLKAMGNTRYVNGFEVTVHWDKVDEPRRWKKPQTIFVNSMSDMFHDKVPFQFIEAVFRTMKECPQHTFQVLTKRSKRLLELSPHLNWTPNIWQGVSVEDERVIKRIDDLKQTAAMVKFLSLEPLIGPLENLPLDGIHWAIVGGESGPGARHMDPEWVRSIRNQCVAAGVPFFFKQWGGVRKKHTGRILDGRTWDEKPRLAHELLSESSALLTTTETKHLGAA